MDLLGKAGCVLYEPVRIKRKAKAQVQSKIIKAEGEIKISEIQGKALNRLLSIETSRQININNISHKALQSLTSSEQSIDESVDIDWIKKYFSFSQDISNNEMQDLWAKVLAGEFIKSGSFSYKTMSILANMRKTEAELYSKICSYIVNFGNRPVPLIFPKNGDVDNNYGNGEFNFENLQFLQSLGLIFFNDIGEYTLTSSSKDLILSFDEKSFLVSLEKGEKNVFNVGKVLLTKEGVELCSVIKIEKITGLMELINNKLITGDRSIKEL